MAETPPPTTPPAKKHTPFDDLEHRVEEARAQFDEASAKINARTGRNLFAAIGIGLVLGGLFLVSLILVKWLFMILAAALIGLTVFELASALRIAGRDVPRVASTVVAVAAVPAAFFLGVEGLWLALLVGVGIISLWRLGELARPSHRAGPAALFADIGAGAFVQVYVTFLAGLYVVLVGLDGGQWWTLASIVIVVVTDIGAYASGLAFGRHKLAPTISPGKTWEGFAGSIVVAVIAGILFGWLMLGQPWWVGLVMGVLLALVGTMGDLTESLIKRDLGVKDISTWLPGHGGFLDRLDSILPSAAVAYVIYLVVTSLG
jgi:phosphatidate cytidylyltransferase